MGAPSSPQAWQTYPEAQVDDTAKEGSSMKKHVCSVTPYAFLLVFCCSLLLGGCGTANISYTTSVPPEKLCTLDIGLYLTVVRFDGEEVDWVGNPWHNSNIVRIPEGAHTFTVYWETGRYASSGIQVAGNFVAGRAYKMTEESLGGGRIRIRIDEVPMPQAGK